MNNSGNERALICPQCNAPLKAHRFAVSTVCAYCGATVRLDEAAVSAEKFHRAYRMWNAPQSYAFSSWISIGDAHWAIDKALAQGEISNIYAGRRARYPTELVILKILRDEKNKAKFDNEWYALQKLHQSEVAGADIFTRLLPQPVLHGDISGGAFIGKRAKIFRRTSGFHHNLAEVIQAYPQGIPPRASIWVWRRILEMLSFIHKSGMVHGAVLPPHLLLQENEHGIMLIGYGAAGKIGEKRRFHTAGFQSYKPKTSTLTPDVDLIMSAKSIIAILGGDPAKASLPPTVPPLLAKTIRRIALLKPSSYSREDAWAIRDELGDIADKVFGEPQFIPIAMPA